MAMRLPFLGIGIDGPEGEPTAAGKPCQFVGWRVLSAITSTSFEAIAFSLLVTREFLAGVRDDRKQS
jgi:hypothetical protein